VKKRKTRKDFETYLLKIIGKYVPILLLQKNTFKIRKSEVSDWEDHPAFDTSYFGCLFNYPYSDVTIIYSEEAFNDWVRENTDMESFIIHEMCHVLTDPLYSKATKRYITKEAIEDEREILTDHICNIVLKRENERRK